ncbi:MAG TPA: response regulator transcription factor, partial [Solirubrobacteraceae bacterium]|nr:response regulator transcription factor [Solirubrobacteraceae bacterium]
MRGGLGRRVERITVYIAEDHPVYMDGIARAIKSRADFELVGQANDGREALDQIRELAPDVAVLDQRLPSLDGVEILTAIQRESLSTRVVMLSADDSSALVYDAVRLGVGAFLTKDARRSAICDAVAAVARGNTVLAPEIQAGLAGELQTRERNDRPRLSEREHEVLRMIAEGLSAPDIA